VLGMGETSRREIPWDEKVWMEWEKERGVLVGDYYFGSVCELWKYFNKRGFRWPVSPFHGSTRRSKSFETPKD
jgi:hypothetical protein